MSQQFKTNMIIGTVKNPIRSSYMKCMTLRPPKNEPEGKKKGSCVALIPKSDKRLKRKIDECIKQAGYKKFGRSFNPNSRKVESPLFCGDEAADDSEVAFGDEARDHWILNMKNIKIPGVVDKYNEDLFGEDLEEAIRSGFYYCFSVNFYAYDVEGKGIGCGLNNIMFIKGGEPLDGSTTAAEDFADYAADNDYDDDYDDDDDDDDDDEPRRPSRRRSRDEDDEEEDKPRRSRPRSSNRSRS